MVRDAAQRRCFSLVLGGHLSLKTRPLVRIETPRRPFLARLKLRSIYLDTRVLNDVTVHPGRALHRCHTPREGNTVALEVIKPNLVNCNFGHISPRPIRSKIIQHGRRSGAFQGKGPSSHQAGLNGLGFATVALDSNRTLSRANKFDIVSLTSALDACYRAKLCKAGFADGGNHSAYITGGAGR